MSCDRKRNHSYLGINNQPTFKKIYETLEFCLFALFFAYSIDLFFLSNKYSPPTTTKTTKTTKTTISSSQRGKPNTLLDTIPNIKPEQKYISFFIF